MLLAAAHPIVHVNATLNALATVLLIVGLALILQRKETAHKRVMLSAFVVSVAFLACYLYYHSLELTTPFTGEGAPRAFYYYFLLPTHVVLAMTVPPLALITITLGLRAHGDWLPARLRNAPDAERREYAHRYRAKHRRWARLTFPIWLYVSVTGVAVYWMLYQL
jgi:putative membrane protein